MHIKQIPSIPDLLSKISVFMEAVEVKKDTKLAEKKEVAEMALNVLFCMVRPYYSKPHPLCIGGIPQEEIQG